MQALQRKVTFGLLGLAVGLVLAFVVKMMLISGTEATTPPPQPPVEPVAPALDTNSQAYQQLVEASRSGRYSEVKRLADIAHDRSSDAALKYIADFTSRNADLMIKCDIHTFQQENSLEGFIKALWTGKRNPVLSLKADWLLLQRYFGDFQKNLKSIDSTYPPRISRYEIALQHYREAMRNYQAAAQQYPINYQIWNDAQKRAQERRESAQRWFWIVLIGVTAAGIWYGWTRPSIPQ
jgi:hypothetical protein